MWCVPLGSCVWAAEVFVIGFVCMIFRCSVLATMGEGARAGESVRLLTHDTGPASKTMPSDRSVSGRVNSFSDRNVTLRQRTGPDRHPEKKEENWTVADYHQLNMNWTEQRTGNSGKLSNNVTSDRAVTG